MFVTCRDIWGFSSSVLTCNQGKIQMNHSESKSESIWHFHAFHYTLHYARMVCKHRSNVHALYWTYMPHNWWWSPLPGITERDECEEKAKEEQDVEEPLLVPEAWHGRLPLDGEDFFVRLPDQVHPKTEFSFCFWNEMLFWNFVMKPLVLWRVKSIRNRIDKVYSSDKDPIHDMLLDLPNIVGTLSGYLGSPALRAAFTCSKMERLTGLWERLGELSQRGRPNTKVEPHWGPVSQQGWVTPPQVQHASCNACVWSSVSLCATCFLQMSWFLKCGPSKMVRIWQSCSAEQKSTVKMFCRAHFAKIVWVQQKLAVRGTFHGQGSIFARQSQSDNFVKLLENFELIPGREIFLRHGNDLAVDTQLIVHFEALLVWVWLVSGIIQK